MFEMQTQPEICPISGQSAIEEIVNSLTHGIGFLLSLCGLITLITAAYYTGNPWHITSCTIYGTTLTILYGASTWYHLCKNPKWKRTLQLVDHISIYLLIAGSYTPFTLGPLKGPWGWSLLTIIWTFAAIGISLKIFLSNPPDWITVLIYLIMGWIALVAIVPLLQRLPTNGLYWLIAGGLSYSLGTIFFLWETLYFAHSIWHLFVLSGSICHFFCITFHVIPH